MKSIFVFCCLFIIFCSVQSVTYAQSCPYKSQGDADCDNFVKLVDFEIWRQEYLGTLSTTRADFNASDTVTLADYQIWYQSFLNGTVSPTVTPTVVATVSPTITQTPTSSSPTPATTGCTTMQNSGPIQLSDQSNVVVECKNFVDLGANVVAIELNNINGAIIRNNTFTRVAEPIFMGNSTGPIVIQGNIAQDVLGPHDRDGSHRGNFVQFDNVHGKTEISNNVIDGGDFEDVISLFNSGGNNPAEAIWVHHNKIRGCRPGGLCWSSDSGSGVMTGDDGGDYELVEKNIFVNAGQAVIGIASGENIIVRDNVMYQEATPKTNVGVYVWNQYPHVCTNHTITNNRARVLHTDGSTNGFWDGQNCTNVTISGNNWDDTTLDATIWNKSFAELGIQ